MSPFLVYEVVWQVTNDDPDSHNRFQEFTSLDAALDQMRDLSSRDRSTFGHRLVLTRGMRARPDLEFVK